MILLSRHLTPCICTKKHLLFPLLLLFFPCCLMLRAFTVPLQPVLQPPLLAQLAAPSTAAMLGSWQHLLWEPGTYLEVARESTGHGWGSVPSKEGAAWAWGQCCCLCPWPLPAQEWRWPGRRDPHVWVTAHCSCCHAHSHSTGLSSPLQTTLPVPYSVLAKFNT